MGRFLIITGILVALFSPTGEIVHAAPGDRVPNLIPEDSSFVRQGEIQESLAWYDDLDNALGVAKEEYRPVLVFFSSPTDGWSNRMKAQVFNDEAVRREMEHYVRVEVTVEDNQETAGNYLVRGIPAIRILSAEGRVLQGRDGFINTPEMVRMLRASLNAEFLKKSDPEFLKLVTVLENQETEELDWSSVMIHLGEPQKRESLRQLILQLDPFPRSEMVTLLSDDRLAVRLGSLEILEEIAGNDFGFNPWKKDSSDPANQAALESWSKWLEASKGEAVSQVFSVLSEEQIASYIRDMIGENRERSLRAKAMLRNGGDNVAKALRNFLDHNNELPIDARNRVRELYYALSVPSIQGSDPDSVAYRLIHGNLDARLEAIAALKEMGRPSLSVLFDFLEDPDPLIRETTIDAVLTAGMSAAVPAVEQHLAEEEDQAVILSALRAIGVNEIRRASKLVASYAGHEEEDLAVMALEALGALRASDQPEVIAAQLQDDRWRVRVAALETIGRINSPSFGPKIRPLLQDEDEFVRAATIQTIAKLGDNGARDDLLKLYQENEELRGPVIQALLSMRQTLPGSLRADLAKSSADTVLQVIDAVGNSRGRDLTVVAPFLDHENLDVACASIRLVGRYGLQQMTHQQAFASILEEGTPEKVTAVLESANFDQGQFRRFESQRSSGDASSGIPPEIQEIYDVLLERKPTSGSSSERSRDPLIAIFESAEDYLSEGADPALRQHAALLLAKAGVPEALRILEEALPTRNISQRKTIALALDEASEGAIPLLVTLMRDPSDEVRTAASSSMLEHTNEKKFIAAFFDELTRPASKLQPHEVSTGYLRSAVRSGTTKQIANETAKEILQSSIRPSLLSFAALTLRYSWKYGDEDELLPLTESEHAEIRRAAWFAMGRNDEDLLLPHLDRIVNDPSEKVRAILPYILGKQDGYVIHYYDSENSQRISDYLDHNFDSMRSRLDENALSALETLSQDSSPIVRIDSSFVLMANGKQPDPAFLETTLSAFPDRDSIQRKVSDYLEENFQKLPKEYSFLIQHMDPNRIGASEVERIYAHFGYSEDGERGANLDWKPQQEDSLEPRVALPGNQEEPARPVDDDGTIELVYFLNPGCKECDRVREHLDELEAAFPRLRIVSHNMRDSASARLNEALSERFGVPERIRMVAPAVFSGDGYLIKEEIYPTKLGNMIMESSASGNSASGWSALEAAEIASAGSAIESRFSTVGVAVIFSAGILDGINPCAFATIILFLSYLQIARHGPRQILMVGLSFISAVFLTYFALGLGLVELVTRLQFLKGVGVALNVGLAIFALVIMFYSLRDGVLCLQGRLADTTLQLPTFLKDRIRKVARKGARHHRYVIAAFLSGVVISVLELACTGQVYLPTINYMVQEGKSSAYGLLLIYNLAFVLPLIIIFILAFYGLRSEALIEFQRKHSAVIKFATAGLFLALFLLLMYQVLR
ncbi:MAG: HEAT repeat domain-containing protein [Verrucomicrobiales bacterium]|nr:HEAT repeat domain-containing protein [Verrucomicrobiales bacterium]